MKIPVLRNILFLTILFSVVGCGSSSNTPLDDQAETETNTTSLFQDSVQSTGYHNNTGCIYGIWDDIKVSKNQSYKLTLRVKRLGETDYLGGCTLNNELGTIDYHPQPPNTDGGIIIEAKSLNETTDSENSNLHFWIVQNSQSIFNTDCKIENANIWQDVSFEFRTNDFDTELTIHFSCGFEELWIEKPVLTKL